MATYWDPMWDDEEWLKNQSAATLRYIYTVAVSRGDKDDKKTMVAARLSQKLEETNKQEKGFKNKNVSEADLLAYTQHMKDTENAGNTDNYNEYRKNIGETVDERLLEYTDTPYKDANGKTPDKSLSYFVNSWKFAILAKASDLLGRVQPSEVQSKISSIISGLDTSIERFANMRASLSNNEVNTFIAADQLGAFEGWVNRDTVENFYDSIAHAAGLRTDTTPANDKALKALIDTTKIHNEDGSLTDLYSDCTALASTIQYDFAEDVSAEDQAKFSTMYNDQLMANAAQRAAQAILQDRGFLARYKTEEDIKAAFKKKVTEQFERSVVLAGLAGDERSIVALSEITIDSTGHVEYNGDADGIGDVIEEIKNGTVKINPQAVKLDKYMLDKEADELAKEMGKKKINETELTFLQEAKNVVKAVWENAKKHKAWEAVKFGSTMLAFGGASVLMAASGSMAAIGVGVGLYAGWTAVNAWFMPVWDKMVKEGKNWKEARKEKWSEPDFKKRAFWRTMEGMAVGGLVGGMGATGVQGWKKIFSRQGLMATAKGLLWWNSDRKLKKAKKELKEAYTLKNFGKVQTAQSFVKQDKTAFWTAVGFAAAGDVAKLGIENLDSISGNGGDLGGENTDPVNTDPVNTDPANTDPVNTDPAQGDEGAAQGDEGAAQGDEGAAQGDEGAAQGDEGAAQGDEGAAQGDEGAAQGDEGATQGDEGAAQGDEGAAQGDEGATQGDEGAGNGTGNEATENGNESGTEHKGLNQREDGRYYGDHKLDDNGPYDIKQVDFDKYEHLQPYDKSMGTSGQAYRTLFRVYGAKELDRMYAALDRDGVMDHFKGMTPTQVLVRFRGLDHWTERFGKDGFSIQGATRYHHEEAMTALNKLLGPCGDRLTDQEYASINKSFEDVDNYGGYHGAGKIAGNNNYVYRSHGYNTKDCPDGQLNEMRSGGQVVHAPKQVTPPSEEQAPETVTTETQDVPQEENVEEVVSNEPQENVKVNAADAQYKFRTTYDNNQDEYVDPSSINGKDHEGWIYDKDKVDVVDGKGNTIVKGSNTREVYVVNQPMVDGIKSTAYPMDMRELVNKFDLPNDIVKGEDGSVRYVYESATGGKDWSIVVDKPENGSAQMHLLQGNREIIPTNETGEAMAKTISKVGPYKCEYQADAGNSVGKIQFSEKVASQRAGAAAGTAAGFTPKASNIDVRFYNAGKSK